MFETLLPALKSLALSGGPVSSAAGPIQFGAVTTAPITGPTLNLNQDKILGLSPSLLLAGAVVILLFIALGRKRR